MNMQRPIVSLIHIQSIEHRDAVMALLLKRVIRWTVNLMNLADPRVDDFFLMQSPLPLLAILTAYALFVFKYGPKFMRKRSPFKLDKIIMAYDLVQVIFNLYMILTFLPKMEKVSVFCTPLDYSDKPFTRTTIRIHHLYAMSKLLDLLDTVFFVLKKKHRQISFLHTYHHIGIALGAWISCKFVPGGQLVHLGIPNVIVHVLMYFYYFLSAYNVKFGQNLWLKRRVTEIQLIQHTYIFVIMTVSLLDPTCPYPKWILYMLVPQMLIMIAMFSDFYYKAYLKKKKT